MRVGIRGYGVQLAARTCILALALAITACGGGGGGSGGSDDESASANADYFPLNIGDRWLYIDGYGVRTRVEAIGTQTTAAGVAMVVRSTDVYGTSDALYVKSPTGVSMALDADADPVLASLGTVQLLKLPLATGDRWTVAEKTLVAAADLDYDGTPEDVAVRIDATVIGFETIRTSAGTFQRAAHVRTELTRSGRLTSNGQTFRDTTVSDDWYAPDVGPIRSLTTGDNVERTDSQLAGWRVGNRSSETSAPSVTGRTPAPNALVFGALPTLQIVFSKEMDTSIPADTVWTVVRPDGQPLTGRAQWLGDRRTVLFSSYEPLVSGRYTARVGVSAVDLLGVPPASETVWTFDVDSSGPQATLVSPRANDPELPLDSVFVISLDDDAVPASVNTSTVTLANITANRAIEASVSYAGRTITLKPLEPLTTGARYVLSVGSITDVHGNATTAQAWYFVGDPGRFAAPQALMERAEVTAVAIGDVDGDGRADALFGTGYNFGASDAFGLYVRRSLGGGNFAAAQRYETIASYIAQIGSLAVADLDGNGRQAVILGASGAGIQIFRQQPDGTLVSSQVIETASSYVVRVGDMNGDGRLDLVGAPFTGTSVSVWLQGADGRFGSATELEVTVASFGDMALGDLDGDGRIDIAVASNLSPGQPVGIILRQTTGGYATVTYPSIPRVDSVSGVAIGEIVSGARQSLLLTQQFSSRLAVMSVGTDGSIAEQASVVGATTPSHGRMVDLDGDGKKDLLSWARGGFPIAINRQRSDGRFGQAETWPVDDYGTWTPDLVAVGDLDGDGRPDLMYSRSWLRQRITPYVEPIAAPLSAQARSHAIAATQALGPLRARFRQINRAVALDDASR